MIDVGRDPASVPDREELMHLQTRRKSLLQKVGWLRVHSRMRSVREKKLPYWQQRTYWKGKAANEGEAEYSVDAENNSLSTGFRLSALTKTNVAGYELIFALDSQL